MFEDAELAHERRGAPFTFNVDAFVQAVQTLRTTPVTCPDEAETMIRLPSFDHALQDPIKDDVCIPSRTRLVIVEGNYTLLDDEPWRLISGMVHDR